MWAKFLNFLSFKRVVCYPTTRFEKSEIQSSRPVLHFFQLFLPGRFVVQISNLLIKIRSSVWLLKSNFCQNCDISKNFTAEIEKKSPSDNIKMKKKWNEKIETSQSKKQQIKSLGRAFRVSSQSIFFHQLCYFSFVGRQSHARCFRILRRNLDAFPK